MAKTYDLSGPGSQFHFVSFQNSDEKNHAETRIARSHAISQGLANKRKLQEKSGLNFRGPSFKHDSRRAVSKVERCYTSVTAKVPSPSPDPSGPFQELAIESPRLRTFLDHCKIILDSCSLRDRPQHANAGWPR